MTLYLEIWIALALAYLAIELASFWVPLAGALFRRPTIPPLTERPDTSFCVLTACRDGADCIPGFVKAFQSQDYAPEKIRLVLVADHCTDNSAALARSLGMDVYERDADSLPGKGNAVNDVLKNRLQQKPFDVLVVMDIDARVEAHFLQRASAYFQATPRVISCATFAKNPDQTLLARVGDLIQALLRLHQEGRAAWGLDANLYGSHGYALSRDALERLEWKTTTGLVAEDMELKIRSVLNRIPVGYASDLPVYNDVTADARSVHQQRQRWNATYPPLIVRYLGNLLASGRMETLFGVMLQPAFANLFLYLTLAAALLAGFGWHYRFLRPWALAAGILWALHVAYFFVAFRRLKIRLTLRDLGGFALHLGIRALALPGGLLMMRAKDWAPAPHSASKEDEK